MTDPVEDMVCVEADGLTLEIGIAAGAAKLNERLSAAGLSAAGLGAAGLGAAGLGAAGLGAAGLGAAGLGALIATAITAANQAAGPAQGAVTVMVDDDARIRALNKLWRGFDKPTNVLSFPSPDTQPGPQRTLGDIAISYETAAREAVAEDKSFADHMAHLSVHGFLHLLGYDHESDDDAEEMEGLERDILARIGVSDPYVAHEAKG